MNARKVLRSSAACVALLACTRAVHGPATQSAGPDGVASSMPGADASTLPAPVVGATTSNDRSWPPLADAYRGTIGAARIVMRLQATPAGIAGRYFYETVGDALALSGTTDDRGHIELTERTRAGKITGTFTGDRLSTGALSGTWHAKDEPRLAPFALAPVMRTSGPALVFKRAYRNRDPASEPIPPALQDGRPTRCDIRVEYPEVFGLESAEAEAKINAALSGEDDRDCGEPCEGQRGYEITINRDGVLGVDVNGEHMCSLAAHPSNYEGFSATFLTRTGQRLGLEQVFKRPFATYTKKLFRQVIDKEVQNTQPDGEHAPAPGDPDADFYRNMLVDAYASPEFVLIEGGVRFVVARQLAHAFQGLAAEPTDLTFAQLKDALEPSSPLAFLWRH